MKAYSMGQRLRLATLPSLSFDLFLWPQFLDNATLVLECAVRLP